MSKKLLLILILSGLCSAQTPPWSGILDPSRATDWTQAGIPGGIPNVTTVCPVPPPIMWTPAMGDGTIPTAAAHNTQQIQNALNACDSTGPITRVVNIPAGTWYANGISISGSSNLNSYVLLRGAGPDKTILLMQSVIGCLNNADICLGNNGNNYGKYYGSATWTGDNGVAGSYNKGDTVINLTWAGSPATTPAVGDLITLDQRDDNLWLCPASGGTGLCSGNQGATESGNTVTLTTSLAHTYAVGNTIYVGGVSHPAPANGALNGQLFQGLTYPTTPTTCTGGVVTMSFPTLFDVMGPQALTINGAGTWASGVETLPVVSNPFSGTSHINGIRSLTISGTGTSLDGNTYILNWTNQTATKVTLVMASAPTTQPTTGTGTWPSDTVWISGSNGIYSGVKQVTGTGTLNFTYSATCGSDVFTPGNYILSPISYTGKWTITDVGCNVAGTYTSSAGCGSNPINALRYTSPVSGLPATGGGLVLVDNGGFYSGCVGGANCASQSGSGWPGAPGRSCPMTNFGTGGTSVCATGEYSYREQREVHQITGISGSAYTITPPIISTNWRSSQNPGAMFLGTGGYVTRIGLEGVTVDATNDAIGSATGGIIILVGCYQCWVKNVRTINGHRNHFWVASVSFQDEIVDSYMWGSPGATKSYGIENSSNTHLFQNNICHNVVTCMMTTGTIGSVISYNYATDTGQNPPTDNQSLITMNHSSDYYSLFEGNDANTFNVDTVHGTGDSNTAFRNRLSGNDIPARVNYLRAASQSSFNRGYNYIGNVLGTPGVQTQYVTNINGSGSNSYVYYLPYWTNDGTILDPLTASTFLRWGNYDTATGGVRWCGNSSNTGWASTTGCNSVSEIPTTGVPFINGNPVPTKGDTGPPLPASFYLSSAPSFWQTTWGTPGWPAIGPDVTASGPLNTTCTGTGNLPNICDGVANLTYQIPAQVCYTNTPIDPAYQQSFTVTNAAYLSGNVTLTIANTGTFLAKSDTVYVTGIASANNTSGANYAGFNGIFAVSSSSTTSITYSLPLSNNPSTGGDPGAWNPASGGTAAGPNILLYNAANCYPVAYAPPATAPTPTAPCISCYMANGGEGQEIEDAAQRLPARH